MSVVRKALELSATRRGSRRIFWDQAGLLARAGRDFDHDVVILVLGKSTVPWRQLFAGQLPSSYWTAAVELPKQQAETNHVGDPHLHRPQQQRTAGGARGDEPGDQRPIADEGVAVGGAFDSDTATGMMPAAQLVAGVLPFGRS